MGYKSIVIFLIVASLFSCKKEEEVVFFEDFSGNSLDTSTWNYELGDGCPNLCGWGNNERQVYTKENIEVKDGSLIITATKDSTSYFSGRITTKD